IVHHLSRLTSLRPDARFSIRFADFVPDTTRVSFFELSPLLRALRAIITRSRALRASDIQPPGEATPAADTLPRIETARVDEARTALLGARASVAAVASTLASWLGDTAGNRTLLLSNVDTILLDAADAGVRVMSFGVRVAVGEWYSWRASTTDRLFALVGQRAERWSSRRDTAAARLLAYDALPAATPDATRFAELETIQRLVAAQAATPRPADPTLARMATGNMLTAFEARLTALEALGQMVAPTLAAVRAAVSALLPLDLFDVEPFSLTELEDEVLRFLADLSSTLTAILDEVDGRLAASQRALVEASSAADAQSRVDALAQAAKATFGEEFRVVPFFDVPSLARGDISNALAHTTSGELLRFQIEQRANRQPVDGWIYGLARVRETLHAWEQVVVHAEAFGATAPALTPLQLPSAPRGPWLALEYPEETIIDSERLCYTACFVRPFDVDAPQCGLLLDEWTEVLPATEQTAAVTFHFDRPNAEPPQVWLLATPSRFGQGWSWDDIVESVREAFERARRRAVEPAQIDMTRYARFLPGVITAATGSPISIATNLARNNGLWQAQAEALHG
ncbi:MAG TPA: hypothetical protein VJ596_10780, partial [Gemmatimonadaceae bacterium]|nr:hypothetical protein [Gemmatimonadaceae bacterium]